MVNRCNCISELWTLQLIKLHAMKVRKPIWVDAHFHFLKLESSMDIIFHPANDGVFRGLVRIVGI